MIEMIEIIEIFDTDLKKNIKTFLLKNWTRARLLGPSFRPPRGVLGPKIPANRLRVLETFGGIGRLFGHGV